ncbi:uncharacterized protein EKO05_0011061 [Ascochyta rabiei]|uniref:uncharacterized protein n=1 Tax=Didymella rabiei TaxID=5454 RepID=UPI0022022FD2|nr:uncharacterized protein EKO05_0011061 [Ascochyta rabiei]UPX20844.1 hypothetical protein EKO05_0011061 [Ascochyta rabiei]
MAANHVPTTYKFIRVPRTSARFAELVTKFRITRLAALETDPASFVSQHATERALPLEIWTKRFSRDATILICVASNDTTPLDDETALIEGEWAGFAALRGPLKYEDYYFSPDMNLAIPENPQTEARWYLYDLYTKPLHRGRGLAKKLVNTCTELAIESTRTLRSLPLDNDASLQKARILLFMNPKNAWLVRMYEGFGFRGTGRVTMTEGFRAGALHESLPSDTESTEELRRFWHTRVGLAMEQVVSVG